MSLLGGEVHVQDNEHAIPSAADGRDLEVESLPHFAALTGDDVGLVSDAKAYHGQCFLAFAGVKTSS